MKKFEPALSSLNDFKLLKHKMKTYEPKLELHEQPNAGRTRGNLFGEDSTILDTFIDL